MKTQWVTLMYDMGIGTATAVAAGIGALSSGGQAIAAGKLNKKNRAWQEKMYGIQRGNALKDWDMQNEYNSPEMQVKRLKEAGLNPALMYGKGGGAGGQTQPVRDATVGNPSTTVPEWGQVGMGISQAMMMGAQMKLMEAQAKKLNVEADKIGGVDTTEAMTRIEKMIAETKNEVVKKGLIELQTRAQQLENQYNAGTIEHRKGLIFEAYAQAEKTTKIISNQKDISDATKQTQIDQAKATLGDTLAGIALKSAGIQKIMTDNRLTEELIKKVFKETNWMDIVHERELDLKGAYRSYYNNATRNQDMTVSEQTYTNLVSHFIGATFDKVSQ